MRHRTPPALVVAVALSVLAPSLGCGSEESAPTDTGGGEVDAGPTVEPVALGGECREDGDCAAGLFCLESEYGPPFCTAECTDDGTDCELPGVAQGAALCVSYEDDNLPNPDTPPFKGDAKVFCVPVCTEMDQCEANNLNWEVCDVPRYLGDPLYPQLGNVSACQAPSYQGKDPVDPLLCDWEKTVDVSHASEANLCRFYCEYLDACKEIPTETVPECCQWGCFNRMIIENQLDDDWKDTVKCYIDTHAAYPAVGTVNSCNQPPKECGGLPLNPTPPAAAP